MLRTGMVYVSKNAINTAPIFQGGSAMTSKTPSIGEVYAVTFDQNSHVQSGFRPAVVIQNKLGNIYSKNVVVLPITSSVKNVDMPTHVRLSAEKTGLRNDSIVLCENPVTIPKSYLRKHITTLSDPYIKEIAIAYTIATGLIGYLSADEVSALWEEARRINEISKEGAVQ